MAETEIEAVREQLASYLKTALQPQFAQLQVLPAWPAGAALPEYAILVQATGEADILNHPPRVVSSTPTSGVNGTVTYQYGWAEGIQLSLDAWASSKAARRTLALAIRKALNVPPQISLAVPNALPVLSRRANVSLYVAQLYSAIFTYRFTQIPTIDEVSDKAQRNEWRSHWRGTADGPLLEQDTTVLLQQLQLQGYVGPGPLGSGAPFNQAISATRPAAPTATLVVPSIARVVPSGTLQLKAYAVMNDNTVQDVTATAAWSSTDVTKATVSSSGLVSGVALGACSIRAISGGFTGACALTVG